MQLTNTNITNRKFQPCCNPNDATRLSALLNAVRFNDKRLLQLLETRTESDVDGLEIATTSDGNHAICFILLRNHNKDFFKYLLTELNHTLTKKCQLELNPFLFAVRLGYRPDYELQLLMDGICHINTTCRRELICNQQNPKENSLHILSQLEGNQEITLQYLLDNGGSDCWQVRDINGYDAYQIAARHNRADTVNYYEKNVFSYRHKLQNSISGSQLLGLIALLFFIGYILKIVTRFSKRYFENYLGILEYYIDSSKSLLCPYHPPQTKNNPKQKQGGHIMAQKHATSEIKGQFSSYPVENAEDYPVVRPGGKIPNRFITPLNKCNAKLITFYIPGTASSVTNVKIETTNATHLAHSLDSKVLIIHHALAPDFKWPHQLNDVCRSIRHYIRQFNPKTINLAGYSIGGFLATLATIVLREFNIKINRLILFSPAQRQNK